MQQRRHRHRDQQANAEQQRTDEHTMSAVSSHTRITADVVFGDVGWS